MGRLRDVLLRMYASIGLPDDFQVKCRCGDHGLMTLNTDEDLRKVLQWARSCGLPSPTLHLFLVVHRGTVVADEDNVHRQLVAVTEALFNVSLNTDHDSVPGSPSDATQRTDLEEDTTGDEQAMDEGMDALDEVPLCERITRLKIHDTSLSERLAQGGILLVGSSWEGECVYDATAEEPSSSYAMILTVCRRNLESRSFDAIVQWPTLGNGMTKVVGKVRDEALRWLEYETVQDEEDALELGARYVGAVSHEEPHCILGRVMEPGSKGASKPVATFKLTFAGVTDADSGYYAFGRSLSTASSGSTSPRPKRKYNLYLNDAQESPTVHDRTRAFKRLTHGAAMWYDKAQLQGAMQQRSQEQLRVQGSGCPRCCEPLTTDGKCPKEPFCGRAFARDNPYAETWFYYDDDAWE